MIDLIIYLLHRISLNMSDIITNGTNLTFINSARQIYMVYELLRVLINTSEQKINGIEHDIISAQSSYNRTMFRLKSTLRKNNDPWIQYKLYKKMVSTRRIHKMLVSEMTLLLSEERSTGTRIRSEMEEIKKILIEVQVSNDSFINETYNTSYFFTSFIDVYRDSEPEPRFWNEQEFLIELLYMYNSNISFVSIVEWSLFDTISVPYNEDIGNNHVNV